MSILLGRARDAVAAHPAAVPLTLAHRHASEESRRLGETLLGVLAGAGFAGRRRVIAFRCLLGHLYGALQLDNLGPLAGPGTAALAELPADRYPLLAETAAEAVGVPPEEEFRRGLALILAGFPDEPGGPG
ncbi:TetR/AcrR family transcriptional regulator C-terminal domain-containing protein [Thermocatellispora tengchongensis]|uniref:TetR/AcrR family transcriptional regulator C-terminal domain-containing protein n=1 Tax=Thermocatellispora tengchongensis TaxID=1073253 RepID=UPI00363828FA